MSQLRHRSGRVLLCVACLFALSPAASGADGPRAAAAKVRCAHVRYTNSVGLYVWKAGPVSCAKARRVMHRWVKHGREWPGWDCWLGRNYYICDRPGPGRAYGMLDPLPGMGD
jgi:hypothetical protein